MRDLLTDIAPPLHGTATCCASAPRTGCCSCARGARLDVRRRLLVFPFGLLALLYTEEATSRSTSSRAGGGTLVSAGGVAPQAVHDAFRRLEA